MSIEELKEVPPNAVMLPVSEMLAHIAETAKQLEATGNGFKCVAIMVVDQKEGWAGMIGGENNFDLNKLLLTARDDLVRGGQGFTVFYKAPQPAAANEPEQPINGHDATH